MGADEVVEVGAVAVGADCMGLGASCFSHPATEKTMATAATAMIAEIFFMLFHPLSFRDSPAARFQYGIKRIKSALRRNDVSGVELEAGESCESGSAASGKTAGLYSFP